MAIASRHPETPGQRQEAGRTVSVTAPTGPVRESLASPKVARILRATFGLGYRIPFRAWANLSISSSHATRALAMPDRSSSSQLKFLLGAEQGVHAALRHPEIGGQLSDGEPFETERGITVPPRTLTEDDPLEDFNARQVTLGSANLTQRRTGSRYQGCAECERDAITAPFRTRGGREAPPRWRG